MLVTYRCPACGHGKARFFITDGAPAPPMQCGDEKIEVAPLMNVHLECVSCGHETVLENAYIEKMDTDYGDGDGVIEVEEIPPDDERRTG